MQNTPPDAPGFVLRVVVQTSSTILHPGHELPAHLGTDPHQLFLLPRLEFVFLSIWRTVSSRRTVFQVRIAPGTREIICSTTLSASRWSVQLTCPSGGLLHAMATRCASCLPLNLRSPGPAAAGALMDGFESLIDEPSPRSGDSEGRLPKPPQPPIAVRQPFVSFQQRKGRLL